MLSGDRDLATALGIVLGVGIMWALGLWAGTYYEKQRNAQQQAQTAQGVEPTDPDAFWAVHTGSPESYQAICADPPNHSQADLCQQWRSAEKAEEIAGYTFLSLFIGIGGLLGLAATVHYARKAALGSNEALVAALDSNTIARESAERQMRAYVQASRPTLLNFVPGNEPVIVFQPTNTGQTPARGFRLLTTYRIDPDAEQCRVRFEGGASPYRRMGSTIDIGGGGQPSQQQTNLPLLTQADYDQFMSGEKKLIFCGVLSYRDVFGKRRRTVFRVRFDPKYLKGGTASLVSCRKNNRSS
jgi:hypothetical protein